MAVGLARDALGRLVRATLGTWPFFEVRNKVLHWPSALRAAWVEQAEVRRLRAAVTVPPALVTTVIPTCARPESLARAVRSALAQTVEDHVVLVVDDGAGLPELPDDDRLVAVSLRRNCGRAGVVRNVGIALSGSPYLAFLDDDNQWRAHHLTTALAALDGETDLVYTAVERVNPDGTRLDVVSREFERSALEESCFVDTNSIVARRCRGMRFSRLPRSGDAVPGEDWELVWRLSRRWRVRHVPTVTVTYLVNPRSYYTRWAPAQAGTVTSGAGR